MGDPLVVIKSILVVVEWLRAEFTSKGSRLSYHPYPWNDDILAALSSGALDIALYNKRRVESYLQSNPTSTLEIVMDFGESMGGQHFYVLGKRKLGLRITTLSEFSSAIRGRVVAIPIKSDMHDTFLDYLASVDVLNDCGITLVHYPTTSGLELLDASPDTLIVSGQNVRYQAKFRNDYEEIVSSRLFSPNLRAGMKERARNCVVVNTRLYARLPKDHLLTLLTTVKERFVAIRSCITDYRKLLDEMVEHLAGGFADHAECEYAISEILRETYGLGHLDP